MNASKLSEMAPRLMVRALLVACSAAVLSGCHQDMWNQPRYEALEGNEFFADGRSARPRVAGTVDYQGALRKWIDPVAYAEISDETTVPPVTDDRFWTGQEGDGFVADNYFEVSEALLERGRERYNVTCLPCHGTNGDGTGIITMRGFPMPPSYHIDRLREVEDGYIFDVITNGFGRMYGYASRVKPEDRWAIAAYIRALQASQNIDVSDTNDLLAQEVQEGIAAQEKAAAEAAKEEAHHGHGHESSDHGTDADSHDADQQNHG
jgi:mono/diheme cytochrome c family protein